jgi:hypothetical protein
MPSVLIPSLCTSCGSIFASRLFNISGNIKNIVLSNNQETCPHCGGIAHLSDGVFTVAEGALSIISAPELTKVMLNTLMVQVQKAYKKKTSAEELANTVEEIDPGLAKIIRTLGGSNNVNYVAVLLIILMALKSCSLDIKLDANQLIEQLKNTTPEQVEEIQTYEM